MSLLYPMSREMIIKKTSVTILKQIVFAMLTIVGMMIFGEISLYYFLTIAVVIYVVCVQSVYAGFEKIETKLLKDLDKFLTDIRYRFRFDSMVEEALEDGILAADYEMALHGQLILNLLRENHKKTYEEPYKEFAPNHFFMTFYIMCETVMIYGDKVIDGQSTFLKNVGYLKEEIRVELLRRQRVHSEFMGLTGITILPIFAIKPIEVWGVSNMPELVKTYEGTKGILVTIILVVLAFCVFQLNHRLRYPARIYEEKNPLILWLCRKQKVDRMLMHLISTNYRRYFQMDQMLKSIVYKYNVKEYLLARMVYAGISGGILGLLFLSIGLSILAAPIGIVSGLVIYFGMPYYLLIRRQMMLLGREEEVIRFQTIILILMHMERMTTERILEHMEAFAYVFRDVIERMQDQLAYKGKAVFEEVKDEIAFLPFERLIDGFAACDRVGVNYAFEDIENDRAFYVEKHKQENEEMVKNKAYIARFIAFIPLCAVIAMKLIIPFVIYGMQELNSFQMTL